jgi:hypothetical protein
MKSVKEFWRSWPWWAGQDKIVCVGDTEGQCQKNSKLQITNNKQYPNSKFQHAAQAPALRVTETNRSNSQIGIWIWGHWILLVIWSL